MTQLMPTASVHGRFQPIHTEHLEYILAAFDRARFVHIGITQFQRGSLSKVEGADPHRDKPGSNPLSYYERTELIVLALDAAGVDRGRYRVGPFPIEHKDQVVEYLPLDVPIFTTRVDRWSDEKIKLLMSIGYDVEVLYNRDPKGVSGTEIRRLMVAGDDGWIPMVPAGTVEFLRSLNLGQRIDLDG